MLRFSPADGSLLPKGLHGLNKSTPETVALVEQRLREIALELVVLDGAEFREPEFCWSLPIAHQGRIVADIKVSADGKTIVPNRKAAEELELLAAFNKFLCASLKFSQGKYWHPRQMHMVVSNHMPNKLITPKATCIAAALRNLV